MANNPLSNFLNRPAELRLESYSYLIRDPSENILADNTTFILDPCRAILMTCRLIFNETSKVLFKHMAERRGILQKYMQVVPRPEGSVRSSCQLGEFLRTIDQGKACATLQEVEQ